VGEVAAREGSHEIDAFLDVTVAGHLRAGSRPDVEDSTRRDEGDRHLAGSPSRGE
jgi:hypothetical protein